MQMPQGKLLQSARCTEEFFATVLEDLLVPEQARAG